MWFQEQELRKVLKMHKVNGADNVSDILTKNVGRELLERHSSSMDMEFRDGRAEKAVQLHLLQRKVRQAKAELRALLSVEDKIEDIEPINANLISEMLDDFECALQILEAKDDATVDACVDEWERKQCRQEGAAMKQMSGGRNC